MGRLLQVPVNNRVIRFAKTRSRNWKSIFPCWFYKDIIKERQI